MKKAFIILGVVVIVYLGIGFFFDTPVYHFVPEIKVEKGMYETSKTPTSSFVVVRYEPPIIVDGHPVNKSFFDGWTLEYSKIGDPILVSPDKRFKFNSNSAYSYVYSMGEPLIEHLTYDERVQFTSLVRAKVRELENSELENLKEESRDNFESFLKKH